MSALWAWMSRDVVVFWVSVAAIAVSLVNITLTAARERRRG